MWSDGSPVLLVPWSRRQPNDLGGQQDCVMMFSTSGLWNDQDCMQRRNWICKLSRGTDVPHQTTPLVPTPGPAGSCHPDSDDWKFNQGYCYYVSSGTSDQTLTWRKARQWCRNHTADLVSILSYPENNFVRSQLLNLSMSEMWIGLNEIGWDLGFKWSDGSVHIPINWNLQQPDDATGAEDCVTMAVRNGKWNDEHCSSRYGFVCKKNISAPARPTLPPPTTSTGYCPSGFSMIGNKCYQGFENRMNWTSARNACQSLGDDQNKYDLASINSELESATLITLLTRMRVEPWIGLRRQSFRTLRWIDNEDLIYNNWDRNQPSGDRYARCVNVGTRYHDAGRWRLSSCSHLHGYVCQTRKKAYITTPEPIPNPCDHSMGFVPAQSGCYLYVNQSSNWTQAHTHCNSMGAFLTSIEDVFEQSFLLLLVNKQRVTSPVWTGLSDTSKAGSYTWADGWPVLYTDWDRGQPVTMTGGGCVVYNTTGLWHVDHCSQHLPYVCKIASDSKPTKPPLPPDGMCPNSSWIHHDDKCFLFSPLDSQTFMDAIYKCQASSATLVSIHSSAQNDFLQQTVMSLTRKSSGIWTGLHRSRETGFQWMDGSPMQYSRFGLMSMMPAGRAAVSRDCMELHSWDGSWNLENCGERRGFICERQQNVDESRITIASRVPPTSPSAGSNTPTSPSAGFKTPPIIIPPTGTTVKQFIPTPQKTGSTNVQTQPSVTISRVTSLTTVRKHSESPRVSVSGSTLAVTHGSTLGLHSNPAPLSPGAIVGIIFGLVVGIAVAAFTGVIFWRKLQAKKKRDGDLQFENNTFRYNSQKDDIALSDNTKLDNGDASYS